VVYTWLPVWLSANGDWHINQVVLRPARLVLRRVLRVCRVSVFKPAIQANSAWPSSAGRQNQY